MYYSCFLSDRELMEQLIYANTIITNKGKICMFILEVSYGCPDEKYPLNGIFQFDQAKALSENGMEIAFVAIDTRSIRRWRHWGLHERLWREIPVIEFNAPIGPILPKLSLEVSKYGFRKTLKKVIKKFGRPDIVHVHFGSTGSCVEPVCAEFNIPYVVTEHSSGVNQDYIDENTFNCLKTVYQNASSVIAVSEALARRIRKYFNIDVTVIPNIIDFSEFNCKKIKHNRTRFISAGNLNEGKGFDVLIKAFAICKSQGMDAELIIMGGGPQRNKLERLVREKQIENEVLFFGEYLRYQFAEELEHSDVFVLASRSETFGIVYAEAMACGIPVVATRCGGPEDFVDRSNGIMVDVNDVGGLSEAILKMYNSFKEYDALSIREGICKKFSSAQVCSEIVDVFNDCAGKARKSSANREK